ncbi:MAG: leucine-rich repeat protein [Lachnospiraceae bacterium]|nr:leucine-rich repeat protein [Lachnospiraceae bacterium]
MKRIEKKSCAFLLACLMCVSAFASPLTLNAYAGETTAETADSSGGLTGETETEPQEVADLEDLTAEEEASEEEAADLTEAIVLTESADAISAEEKAGESDETLNAASTSDTDSSLEIVSIEEVDSVPADVSVDDSYDDVPSTVTVIEYLENYSWSYETLEYLDEDLDYYPVEITGYSGQDTDVIIPSAFWDNYVNGDYLDYSQFKVMQIGDSVFTLKEFITSVCIPNTVTEIGASAFASCTGLTSATFYAEMEGDETTSLETIGDSAFYDTALTSFTCPDSLKAIGNLAFSETPALTSVTLNDGLESLGIAAFSDSGITSIDIPDSVTSIGSYAFSGDTDLTSVEIPSSVTELQYGTFYGCTSLSSITLPDTMAHLYGNEFHETSWYESQSDGAVYLNKVFYSYKGTMYADTSLEIKSGTTCISGYACEGQENLVSVTLPEGLLSIGYGAFLGTGLTSIYIPSSVTTIDKGSVGYKSVTNWPTSDDTDVSGEVIEDFIIYGYSGTAAETYASENGITFVALVPAQDISACTISGIDASYVYTGDAICPEVTLTLDGEVVSSDYYTVEYEHNTDAGTAAVTITGNTILTGSVERTFTITKADQTLEAAVAPDTIEVGGNAQITANGQGTITYTSGDTSIAAVDETTGVVTGVGAGTVVITVEAEGTGNYNSAKATVTITVNAAEEETEETEETETEKTEETNTGNTSDNSNDETETPETAAAVQLPAVGSTYSIGKLKYKVTASSETKKTVTVTGPVSKSVTSITVPAAVTIEGMEYQVTAIAAKAFSGCKKLKKVTIGTKVASIGKKAFYGCKKLKKVNIKSKVLTSIGASAFQGCTAMKSFVCKSTKLKSIGKKAFYGDRKLNRVSLKTKKLKASKVKANAFKGIKSTCTFRVPASKVSAYKKIFRAKGAGSSIKMKKL